MTLKQKLFIQKYLEFRNATRAVLEIYHAKNRNSAGVIGYNLLRNVKVRKEIDRITEAEGTIPSCIVKLIENVSENGSTRDQIKVAKLLFRFYGLI